MRKITIPLLSIGLTSFVCSMDVPESFGHNPFKNIPLETTKEIIGWFSRGQSVGNILKLRYVDKAFYEVVPKSPVSISLSKYCGRQTKSKYQCYDSESKTYSYLNWWQFEKKSRENLGIVGTLTFSYIPSFYCEDKIKDIFEENLRELDFRAEDVGQSRLIKESWMINPYEYNKSRGNFKNIISLNLSKTTGTAKGLVQFPFDYPNIRNILFLNLSETDIQNVGLKPVLKFHKLQMLNLGNCTKFTTKGLIHIQDLTCLTTLDLSGTDIIDGALGYLQKMKSLHTLTIRGTKIGNDGLRDIKFMTALGYLDMSDCTNITNGGLPHLMLLINLEQLYLGGTKVTDAGLLTHVQKLTNLYVLGLDQTYITNTGLGHLSSLSNLRSLSLNNCPNITAEGMKHLVIMPNLKSIDLRDCKNLTPLGRELVKSYQ